MQIEPQSGFQRGKGHFIRSQRALKRVLLQTGNHRLLTNDNPRLRTTQQLIAGEAHQTDSRRDHLLRHRLFRQTILAQVNQRTTAQISHHRNPRFAANRRQSGLIDGRREALDAVIAGMDLHQQPGILIHGLTIIFRMGAVGGADFMQDTTRLAHHIGNTECTADLHQLAAREHHFFTAGGGRQHQQHRRSVIVDDAGIFRAGYAAQQLRQRPIAVAAPGIIQAVLQRDRRTHRLCNCVNRRFCLNCAPQVGMQHRAGEIEHRAQRALQRLRQPSPGFLRPVIAPGRQRLLLTNVFPRLLQHLAQQRHHLSMAIAGQHSRKSGIAKQTVGGRQPGVKRTNIGSHEWTWR